MAFNSPPPPDCTHWSVSSRRTDHSTFRISLCFVWSMSTSRITESLKRKKADMEEKYERLWEATETFEAAKRAFDEEFNQLVSVCFFTLFQLTDPTVELDALFSDPGTPFDIMDPFVDPFACSSPTSPVSASATCSSPMPQSPAVPSPIKKTQVRRYLKESCESCNRLHRRCKQQEGFLCFFDCRRAPSCDWCIKTHRTCVPFVPAKRGRKAKPTEATLVEILPVL